MTTRFEPVEPSRADVDVLTGSVLLEFGSPTCGWCRAALPLIEGELARQSAVRHLKIADGRGQPLGRSFRVKLWPTLVFLRDGHEATRLVRPSEAAEIGAALRSIVAAADRT